MIAVSHQSLAETIGDTRSVKGAGRSCKGMNRISGGSHYPAFCEGLNF
jgi:hypothetical protein